LDVIKGSKHPGFVEPALARAPSTFRWVIVSIVGVDSVMEMGDGPNPDGGESQAEG
jgi:hypothetical protein